MPVGIAGLRGTGEFTTDFRPTNYRELYTLLEPNGSAPLQALLAMASSNETDDPKYNHFRDELPDRVVTINNGAGYDAVTTTLTIDNDDDEGFIVAGTTLYNPRTGELMRADADANLAANTISVERNIAGGALTINDGDTLVVVGHADKEAGNSPTAISFDPTVDFNYTQIFKTAVQVSGTLQNTYLRTGSKESEQLEKALKLHMGDIERAMFFGTRQIVNGTTSQPVRYTGGLVNLITNVIDVNSAFTTADTMTEKEFDQTLIENIFAWGSRQKVAFCGPRAISNLMEIAKNRWQPDMVEGSYGIKFTRYQTFAGDLMVHLHPMFRQVTDMNDAMVILDLPYVNYKYMKGRDTQLQRNIHTPDFDGVKHQYLTECGLEFLQGKVHTYVKNWVKVS